MAPMVERSLELPLPIVESKLHPPAPRPGTIDRPHLVRLLADHVDRPIATLFAPPGYGKTTLLAAWARDERRPLSWLTIDDLDNDPAVLLSYLAVAFDRIQPVDGGMRAALAASGDRLLATAVPRLAFALHSWGRPGVIILDEAHHLVDRTSLDAVAALLHHLPAGFRVAIAGRMEPDLPLARLRSQRRLLEIGPDLLAFSEEEAAALTEAAGYRLAPDEVRELTLRTEGWAAGIYLAAAAEGGQSSGVSVAGLSGRDRPITSYFRSEVERGLGDGDVTFLTRTAILDTVSAPVAEAVTGMADAGERLERLARRNLLIQEMTGTPGSYRYHRLLRDFLEADLERREPATIPDLHRRAATWLAASGSLEPAVEHAFASGDRDAVARLVTAVALPMVQGGRSSTLGRWLDRFDTPDFEHLPPLAVVAAWAHLLAGRADAANRMADIVERGTWEGPPGDGSTSFESSRGMLRAVMGRRGPRDVLANAEVAVAEEDAGSPWRSNALWLMGSGRWLLGDVEAADAALADALTTARVTGSTVMVALAKRASIAIRRGDWDVAALHARQSQAQLEAGGLAEIAASLLTYAVAARLAAHGGDVIGARNELVRAQIVRPLVSHAAPWFAVDALLEVARAYLAISDHAGAQVAIREAEQIARRRPALGILTDELLELHQQLEDAAATLAGSSALTTAELRLLPLLPTYLSYQEIAERMLVSRNTIKTHAMSIYGKLQATGRSEAVERAVELGLLEPYPGLEPAPPRFAG